MALTKPALPQVNPGEPITAQGWNGLRDATLTLYDAVLALGQGVLQVDVRSGAAPLSGAVVVAVPDAGGPPVAAVPPFADRTTYEVTGVAEGNWTVHVAAAGFAAKATPVALPRADPLVVDLAPAGVAVPDLFGLTLQDALTALRGPGIGVDRILDALGHDVAAAAPAPEQQVAPVLAVLPPAGTVVDPVAQRVRLVIAAAVREEPVVTMPALAGLTQTEAARVLQQLGLRLGNVTVV